jgi:hypothetical protein
MLYACFTLIALCFVYSSWHFYAFSGTNLLTRCHSASSCFLLFFYTRFLPKEIFSELDETKAKVPIFLTRRRAQRGDGDEPGGGRTIGWHGPTPGRAWLWCGPLGCPPTSPFRLYIAPDAKTLRGGSLHPWKVPQHRRHRRQVSRDRNLYSGSLPGRGIAPGAISIDSSAIFIAVADSHDEEGVVLPRGWGLYR